jgi:hypothetical protein
MMGLPIRVELANDVTVQSLHDADRGEHCWPGLRLRDQDQGLNGGLPFLDLLFCLRQFLDISGGILQRDELATTGQRYRIVERPFPALGCVTRRDQRPPA